MLHLSPETEALARRIAAARHLPVEQAVRLAVEASARILADAPGPQMPRDELIQKMEQVSSRAGARPLVDPRSADELLGYDEYGLPR
jgi:antitoxin VapB